MLGQELLGGLLTSLLQHIPDLASSPVEEIFIKSPRTLWLGSVAPHLAGEPAFGKRKVVKEVTSGFPTIEELLPIAGPSCCGFPT